MKIIVGLGNPGKQYEGTRHNAGFMVLDALVQTQALNPGGEPIEFGLDKKLKSRVVNTVYKSEKIILVKPETFMNTSGIAVSRVTQYYKARIEDLIIISDDIDIPLGEARVRARGGSAGQKGLQNIIDTLGSEEFPRIRVGINSSNNQSEHDSQSSVLETADYVLQRFSDREAAIIKNVINLATSFLIAHLDSKSEIVATTLR